MFRKLVSALPFSPALVGQLGFYARRLRKEELTRRLGLIFTALALVMQSLALISPPQAANAANDTNFIRGGVRSVSDILAAYDQSARGNGDFKDIMDYAGITRADLQNLQEGTVNSVQFGRGSGAVLTWGRLHRFSSAQGEVKHTIPLANGTTSTVYSKPLWLYDSTSYTTRYGSTYKAFVGWSPAIGWFAISKDCGNLLTQKTPKPSPSGRILTTDCQSVSGYAYDARRLSAKVQVYLYFGGPPGIGEQAGPYLADQAVPMSPQGGGYGFSIPIPNKFRQSGKATDVYGVMVPLPGWSEGTVQLGAGQIPANCQPPAPTPTAACAGLNPVVIDRTRFRLNAQALVKNGAKVLSYLFVVKDSNGKIVGSQEFISSNPQQESNIFALNAPGTYTASVDIKTSLGNSSSTVCSTPVTIATEKQCPLNPQITISNPACQPCPGNGQLWLNNPLCKSMIVEGKAVKNLTQGISDANNTTANPGDKLEYTITAQNIGNATANITMKEQLADVLEYSALWDNGGAQYVNQAKALDWGQVTIQPGQKQTRKFVVRVLDNIPATPQGTGEPGSYDCILTNTYGNTVNIRVACPPQKLVEQTIRELPKTGPGDNLLFGGGLMTVVTYFYARSRQLGKEVRLIRREFNAGTL